MIHVRVAVEKNISNVMESKYIKFLVFCLFAFFIQDELKAQTTISEESRVQQAVSKYSSLNRQQNSIDAWRIQVVTTIDRREMERAIVKLNGKYPALEYHWKHASPYYQLKVGAYEEKADLQNMLITLKGDFPSAIPVKDNMEKSELIH